MPSRNQREWDHPLLEGESMKLGRKLHRLGIEPVTLTVKNDKDLRTAENSSGSESGALFRQTVQKHPDLTRIVEAWPTLPYAFRRAIVGMIEAAFQEDNP